MNGEAGSSRGIGSSPALAALLAVTSLLSAPVSAGAAGEARPFQEADWAKLPSDSDVLAAWPAAAKPGVYEGQATVECAITADRTPTACRVVKEDPEGQGFGAAALALAGKMRLKSAPATTDPRYEIVASLRSPKFVRPDWLKRPTRENILAVYPKEAMRKGRSGKATIACKVSVQGRLYACQVADEDPKGAYFGEAALAMTPQLFMKPARLDGQPVVSDVRIPVQFNTFGAYGTGNMKSVLDAARDWAEAPAYADVAAAYPPKAAARGLAGKVTLVCGVNARGGLKACVVISEAPKGAGFGSAAMKLAQKFRLDPSQVGGVKTSDLQVQLPVTFATEMLSSATPTIGKPRWAALPTSEEAGDVYPAAARQAKVFTGRAILLCRVQALGRVACEVQSEMPTGLGFGAAAMKLVPYVRLTNWTIEGLPVVGGQISVPIRFELPEQPPPAPKP